MARHNNVDERLIPQIAANLLLVQDALGTPNIPYLLTIDIIQHTTTERAKALDIIGYGKTHGLWDEADSPGMGMKPLVLSPTLKSRVDQTSTSLKKDDLLAMLERHGLTTTKAFIDAWVEEKQVSDAQEEAPQDQALGEAAYYRQIRLQVIADHLAIMRLVQGDVPAAASLWIITRAWPDNVDPSSNRTKLKNSGYLGKKRIGNTRYWFVEEKGKRAVAESGMSASFTDDEARAFLATISLPSAEQQTQWNIQAKTRVQVLTDHRFFEEMSDGPLDPKITKNLFGHHYPRHKNKGKGYPSRTKRRDGTLDFIDKDGRCFWFVTQKGHDEIEQLGLTPSFTEEKAKRFMETVLTTPRKNPTPRLNPTETATSVTARLNNSACGSLDGQINKIDREITLLQETISKLEEQVKLRYEIRLVLANARTELEKLKQDP